MKRIATFFFATMMVMASFAQELETVSKPYGSGYSMTVIVPTVDNFITLVSLSETQFEAVMKKYKYFEENSEGRYRSFWNGSLDNYAYAKCVNTYLYNIIGNEIRFMLKPDMAYPTTCMADLFRALKPYYKQSKSDSDGYNVDLFAFKIDNWGYYITIKNNGRMYDISAWREIYKEK